jgi:DNA-binding MarR family transcriptional regulator
MNTTMPPPVAKAVPPPDPQTDPFGALEREIRFMFRRGASNAVHTARAIHPQLEASAYPLLAHIYGHPGTRGSDLAAHFGVGRATVSRQLARLWRLGLIEREVDPQDTRGQLITLTPDGAERLRVARDGRRAALQRTLAEWPVEDVTTLATLMRRFLDDLMRAAPVTPRAGPAVHEPQESALDGRTSN